MTVLVFSLSVYYLCSTRASPKIRFIIHKKSFYLRTDQLLFLTIVKQREAQNFHWKDRHLRGVWILKFELRVQGKMPPHSCSLRPSVHPSSAFPESQSMSFYRLALAIRRRSYVSETFLARSLTCNVIQSFSIREQFRQFRKETI